MIRLRCLAGGFVATVVALAALASCVADNGDGAGATQPSLVAETYP